MNRNLKNIIAHSKDILPALHISARGPFPLYPTRGNVPDKYVSFNTVFRDYSPVEYTHQSVIDVQCNEEIGYCTDIAGHSDIQDASLIKEHILQRKTFETDGHIEWNTQYQRPQNPWGRTGMTGRGMLWRWGPNHAADPVVFRINPITGEREVVLIERSDTGMWAFPGGMVDADESSTTTASREFNEEVLNIDLPNDVKDELLNELFHDSLIVYEGYVDGARTTDHAWIETTCVKCDANMEISKELDSLKAGDDAKRAGWFSIERTKKGDSMKRLKESFESQGIRLFDTHIRLLMHILDNKLI